MARSNTRTLYSRFLMPIVAADRWHSAGSRQQQVGRRQQPIIEVIEGNLIISPRLLPLVHAL